MVSRPLDEIWAKFRRAQEHRNAWNAALDAWLDRNPYGVRGEAEQGTDWFMVRLVELKEPPFIELALIFADYLHNLRATLDHIVWHLVDIASPADNTGFPVVKKSQDWGSALNSKLAGFNSDYIHIIKDAQPFNDGAKFTQHWLYLLHQFDIRNKHRLLVRLGISDFNWEPTFELNRPAEEGDHREDVLPTFGTELRDGVELVRVRAISEKGDLRVVKLLKVENVHIGLGPFSELITPMDQLPNWSAEVERIITALAPAFG